MEPALSRAARGLLDWQQQDLAKAAGLSLSAVNNFERGTGKTRITTAQSIQVALERAGIDFLSGGGLRRADEIIGVQRYSGSTFVEKMNDDMYAAIRTEGQEILTCSTDETLWFQPSQQKLAKKYYEWRSKLGAKEWLLVPDDNRHFESHKHQYRVLPKPLIGKITYTIYADRIAFIAWRKQQVFILRGRELVAPFREQFKYLWRLGKKVE